MTTILNNIALNIALNIILAAQYIPHELRGLAFFTYWMVIALLLAFTLFGNWRRA